MHIQWTSRQGRQRATNCDAAALAIAHGQLIVMLVDAAERSASSQGFASHWCRTIVQRLGQLNEPIDANHACAVMQHQQRLLRHEYLFECGSYCLLILNLKELKGTLLHVGDCLTTTLHANQQQESLNQPHNLLQQPGIQIPDSRHILTRSLNARRFHQPHQSPVALTSATQLQMVTDGYWAEHLAHSRPLQTLDDDASILTISLAETHLVRLSLNSDCDNFHLDPDTCVSVEKDAP